MFVRIKLWLLEKLRKLLHGFVDRSIDAVESKVKPNNDSEDRNEKDTMNNSDTTINKFKSPVDTKGGKIVAVLVLLALSLFTASAQTFKTEPLRYQTALPVAGDGTNTLSDVINQDPTVAHGVQEIIDAVTTAPTNVWYTTYGMYAPALEKKYGGGIGAFTPLSDYFVAGVRIDYVNGGFWMPSGSATFQVPLKWKFIRFTPLTYAGIGIPLSGAKVGNFSIPGEVKDNNGQATAILGYGGAIQLYESEKWKVGLVGDVETWSGFPDKQYRFGLVTKFSF